MGASAGSVEAVAGVVASRTRESIDLTPGAVGPADEIEWPACDILNSAAGALVMSAACRRPRKGVVAWINRRSSCG
jgi:hypothetical protein